MQIANEKVVMIHYTLTNEAGDVLDSSENSEPLGYIHGNGNIIPGLENALEGKSKGDKLNVVVTPEEGYGVRDDNLIQNVPESAFQGVDNIEPGMQFQAQGPNGAARLVTVVSINDGQVVVDGNHPLAGETLTFDVEISDVREATETEKEHGHIHSGEEHEH